MVRDDPKAVDDSRRAAARHPSAISSVTDRLSRNRPWECHPERQSDGISQDPDEHATPAA